MAHPEVTDVNLTKGLDELLRYTNTVSNSWISNMILIGIYVITLMGIYNYKKDFVEGLAIAGFFTFLIALLFWISGFISAFTLVITIALAIAGFIFLWFGKKAD